MIVAARRYLAAFAVTAVLALGLGGCGGGSGPETGGGQMMPKGVDPSKRNQANSIHGATGIDLVRGNDPLKTNLVFPFGTGTNQVGVSQSSGSGWRLARPIPWINRLGDVNFSVTLDSGMSAAELDPLAWLGRFVDTSAISAEPVDIDTTYTEDTNHGLGNDWRAFEVRREYAGNGTWTINIATDAHDSHLALEKPWVGYGDFGRTIELSDIPALPANRDWQGVNVADGLNGSLDGVTGRFTCDTGVSACYLELARDLGAVGYYPYKSVVFTRDDNGMSELLPAASISQAVSPAEYLAFGTWIYVPEDPTATSDYDFGAFAGGGSPFGSAGSFATDRLRIYAYTATYNGRGHGLYYTDRSSATPSVGAFNAHVTMTADFELQAGEIDAGTLSGIVENIRYDGAAPGFPAQVVLEVTHIESFYVNSSRGMSAVGVARDGEPTTTWAGQWQAVFFRELNTPYEDPTAVAGTFGATNDQDGMVGAFGAHR